MKRAAFSLTTGIFLLRCNGDVIEDHLLMDGLHLSARGTRCLLENLSLSTKASGKLDGARPQGK